MVETRHEDVNIIQVEHKNIDAEGTRLDALHARINEAAPARKYIYKKKKVKQAYIMFGDHTC